MLIEIAIGAVADEAAVALVQRQLVGERRVENLLDVLRHRPEPRSDSIELLRQAERRRHGPRCAASARAEAMASRTAPRSRGPPRFKRKPRQRARQVRRALQLIAQRLAQARLAGEIGDGVEAGVDGGGIGERTAEPACKLARAGAGDGAVDGGEQAAGAGALVRAHELEIGAGRGVDQEQAARRLFARRPHQWRAADLGDLDIGEEAGERGKLRLR